MPTPPPPAFRLDTASGVPFYRQIIDRVLLGVADGSLPAGTRLPTVRQLSVDLSINLNTVARAYREMEIRGIVQTQQGTGTFVAERGAGEKASDRRRALSRLVEEFAARAGELGFTLDDLAEELRSLGVPPRRR